MTESLRRANTAGRRLRAMKVRTLSAEHGTCLLLQGGLPRCQRQAMASVHADRRSRQRTAR